MRQDAISRLSEKAINAHIDALSREPFREMLKRLLQAEPSLEAVRQYSERCPDRYGQLVTMIAKLAGYHERLEVETSHSVAISQMSDAELYRQLEQAQEWLGQNRHAPALPSGKHPNGESASVSPTGTTDKNNV